MKKECQVGLKKYKIAWNNKTDSVEFNAAVFNPEGTVAISTSIWYTNLRDILLTSGDDTGLRPRLDQSDEVVNPEQMSSKTI
ncbi:hypothetical protein [Pedobacter panaciterrae]